MAVQRHIRNPFEVIVEQFSGAVSDAGHAMSQPRHQASTASLAIRRIGARDLWDCLRKGAADAAAVRADVLFIGLIYPLAGLVLARLAFSYNLVPLVFPLVSGFALIGPLAAIGLYEISRRREHGQTVGWLDAVNVVRSPALPAILGLGAILLGLFLLWMLAAYQIFMATLGPEPPASLSAFIDDVLTTPAGWTMIGVGVGVGFLFAVVALAISVVSFPLVLDRDVGVRQAVATSLRAVAANPATMSLWGLIVAGALVLGSLPALVGLIFVIPLLGHATWHLYRKVVGDPAESAWHLGR